MSRTMDLTFGASCLKHVNGASPIDGKDSRITLGTCSVSSFKSALEGKYGTVNEGLLSDAKLYREGFGASQTFSGYASNYGVTTSELTNSTDGWAKFLNQINVSNDAQVAEITLLDSSCSYRITPENKYYDCFRMLYIYCAGAVSFSVTSEDTTFYLLGHIRDSLGDYPPIIVAYNNPYGQDVNEGLISLSRETDTDDIILRFTASDGGSLVLYFFLDKCGKVKESVRKRISNYEELIKSKLSLMSPYNIHRVLAKDRWLKQKGYDRRQYLAHCLSNEFNSNDAYGMKQFKAAVEAVEDSYSSLSEAIFYVASERSESPMMISIVYGTEEYFRFIENTLKYLDDFDTFAKYKTKYPQSDVINYLIKTGYAVMCIDFFINETLLLAMVGPYVNSKDCSDSVYSDSSGLMDINGSIGTFAYGDGYAIYDTFGKDMKAIAASVARHANRSTNVIMDSSFSMVFDFDDDDVYDTAADTDSADGHRLYLIGCPIFASDSGSYDQWHKYLPRYQFKDKEREKAWIGWKPGDPYPMNDEDVTWNLFSVAQEGFASDYDDHVAEGRYYYSCDKSTYELLTSGSHTALDETFVPVIYDDDDSDMRYIISPTRYTADDFDIITAVRSFPEDSDDPQATQGYTEVDRETYLKDYNAYASAIAMAHALAAMWPLQLLLSRNHTMEDVPDDGVYIDPSLYGNYNPLIISDEVTRSTYTLSDFRPVLLDDNYVISESDNSDRGCRGLTNLSTMASSQCMPYLMLDRSNWKADDPAVAFMQPEVDVDAILDQIPDVDIDDIIAQLPSGGSITLPPTAWERALAGMDTLTKKDYSAGTPII